MSVHHIDMFLEHSITDEGFEQRWRMLDWVEIENRVLMMQHEIASASLRGDIAYMDLAKRALINSFEARALAVRDVTKSESTKDPGWGESWLSDADKGKAVSILSDFHYRSESNKRFEIYENKSKKNRWINMPSFFDRAIHDLYRLAESPAIESKLDKRLFSSREGRGLADACAEVVHLLSGPEAPEYVLICDVSKFYDSIDHDWLYANVGIDKDVFGQILNPGWKKGYGDELRYLDSGLPTGDRLAPILANIALNGIGDGLQDPDDPLNGVSVRWVDDILITARTAEDAKLYLGHVIDFLAERKLHLNMDKTRIANTRRGFEFLKYRFKRYQDSMEVFPSEEGLQDFRDGISVALSKYDGSDRDLVRALNYRITGFMTKYKVSKLRDISEELDSSIVDGYIDAVTGDSRIPRCELEERIITMVDGRRRILNVEGLDLDCISAYPRVPLRRLNLDANPFLDLDYFDKRKAQQNVDRAIGRNEQTWIDSKGRCAVCNLPIQHIHDRTIAEDNGVRAYVHTDCRYETFSSGLNGRFGSIPERGIRGRSTEAGIETPAMKVRKEVQQPVPRRHTEPVVYTESPVAVTKTGKVSKFQPLTEWLHTKEESELVISMGDVESVLGFGLSPTMKTMACQWNRRNEGMRLAVESAGWTIGKVDTEKQTVSLTHRAPKKYNMTEQERSYQIRQDPMMGSEEVRKWEHEVKNSRFGRFIRYLLNCEYDQLYLTFDRIEGILNFKLPESAKSRNMWMSRSPGKMLTAIEAGNFLKVDMDLDGKWVLIARVYCEPDGTKNDVKRGGLKVKQAFMNKLFI